MFGTDQTSYRRELGLAGLALVLAFVLTLTACGSDSGSGVASAAGNGNALESDDSADQDEITEEDAMKFAECMRENGVTTFPDPTVDEDGNVSIFGGGRGGQEGQPPFDRQSQTFQDASEVCRDLLPNLTVTEEDQSEMQDQLLEFAQCLRDEGIDVPDPDFSEGGGGLRSIFEGIDPSDPRVSAAIDECESPFGGEGGGPGPFGGGGGGGR